METEGFAIYDAMMQLKNEVCFFSLRMHIKWIFTHISCRLLLMIVLDSNTMRQYCGLL